jgi:hypothetical protein
LIELQKEFRIDYRRKPRNFAWVVVVCLFLMALLTVVEVAHMHPYDNKDADHCPLCIALQTAAPVAVAAAIVVLVRFSTATPVYVPRVAVQNRHIRLFTRPPPLG